MREWGPQSYEKLEIFTEYVQGFVIAAKGVSERVYLDAFAGDTVNVLKTTGEHFPGSAEVALGVRPPFTSVRLFEKSPTRVHQLEELLQASSEVVDAKVCPGDANVNIPAALQGLPKWAPTFAFLDPDGMEIDWATVCALADHKRAWAKQQPKRTKVEMWVLFSTSGMVRNLGADMQRAVKAGRAERVAKLYGAWGPWERIWQAKRTNEIDDATARRCYAYLYMDRLASLGYRYLLARPIHNSKNELYVMVFATDHPVGHRIMESVQQKKRVIRRDLKLFEMPEERPQYETPWRGWRDDLPFELPEWVELSGL